MKYAELKNMSLIDKEKKLKDFNMQLIKLNLQVSTGTALKKSKEIRDIKKDIARILTANTCESNNKKKK